MHVVPDMNSRNKKRFQSRSARRSGQPSRNNKTNPFPVAVSSARWRCFTPQKPPAPTDVGPSGACSAGEGRGWRLKWMPCGNDCPGGRGRLCRLLPRAGSLRMPPGWRRQQFLFMIRHLKRCGSPSLPQFTNFSFHQGLISRSKAGAVPRLREA
jgi:hypothetical protein